MLAQRIRTLREARGWSKSKLAGEAGVTEDAVRKIEAGTRLDPYLSTVQGIAHALSVTVSDLLGEAPTDDTEAREVYRQVMGLKGVDGRQFLSKLAKIDEAGMGLLETFATGWLASKG